MGWLSVAIGVIACIIFYGLNEMAWIGASIFLTVATFWSWGVMHNYAIEAAKTRPGSRGGFFDIIPSEVDSVPNWIALLNFAFALGCLAMLITALILLF